MLIDSHNRTIDYLRLAVTDRCNLRCNYCMPEEGIRFAHNRKLLSIDELVRVARILVGQGINKIRITGGEPFARKDIMVLLRELAQMDGLDQISITTNATLIGPHIDKLKSLGIRNINVSMDAIDRATFERITRRDQYETVHNNLMRLITEGFNVRINFIVLENQNEQDMLPILKLTKDFNVSVRYLEEMPFNGGSREFAKIKWDYKSILEHIRQAHPDFVKLESPATSTSINYKIPGYKGSFGVIPSFTRTFCGSCNRLRVSATGDVITCLYASASANLRDFVRNGSTDVEIAQEISDAVAKKAKTGWDAQHQHEGVFGTSMTSIGG